MIINTHTINSFIISWNRHDVPDFMRDYIASLTESELNKFYHDYKAASSYLIDDRYLIYKLRWILKEGYENLTSSLYIELACNVENFDLDQIISNDNYYKLFNLYDHLNPCI